MNRGMFYGPVDGLDADLDWLKAHGWDAVIGGDDPAFQQAVCARGMAPWTCLGAFTPPGDDPALLCLDVNGTRQQWFGSGCPNHPAVRASSLERHQLAASRKHVAGVFLDGIRFASPASGLDAFCTCFCEHCARASAEMGLDFARMQREVTEFHRHLASGKPLVPPELAGSPAAVLGLFVRWPGVCDWLWFRRRTITDFVAELAQVIHGEGKLLGAYLFSPCLAPLVGQDYAMLVPFVDVFAPMLYRNVNERDCIAPINTELHVIASWADQVADPAWMLGFAGLPPEAYSGRDDLLTRGVSPEAVGVETARARALIGPGKALAPILWWDDPDAGRTVECTCRGGADGVQVFRFIAGVRERWGNC
ncbi:MAG: hypothetical protein ACYC7E_06960 [Armatimonadota bacterium]